MGEGKAVRLFFAYILIAVGGLITLLSGGCTVVWLGFLAWNIRGGLTNGSIFNLVDVNAFGAIIGLTMIFGGLPIAAGVALFSSGRRMAEDER